MFRPGICVSLRAHVQMLHEGWRLRNGRISQTLSLGMFKGFHSPSGILRALFAYSRDGELTTSTPTPHGSPVSFRVFPD